MITDFILSIFYFIFDKFISFIPNIDLSVLNNLLDSVKDIIAFIAFILPLSAFVVIFNIIVNIVIFCVVISFIKTLWDLLPVL